MHKISADQNCKFASMPLRLAGQDSSDLIELIRLERCAFAAKIRVARAVLGWSQSELAAQAGLTQRAVHKLEKGDTEPRRMTIRAMETIWREQGLEFEETGDGGFRVAVRSALLDLSNSKPRKQRHRVRALILT
jgi:transcriptional regulator with XRE-family HTH domain